jgi:ParB-like nuclease domain.
MNTQIITVNPRELKLLEVNARYMKHEEFMRLVENVKRDGKLTSVPFVHKDKNGEMVVLSGNHRVQAAIAANLETIDIMMTEDDLSEQQKIAIQLSHNAIAGQDDPAILKMLYEQIADIDLKLYTGLDDKTLELMEKAAASSLNEASLDFQTVTMVFLPDELEHAKKVFEKAKETVKKNAWLARFSDYDQFLDSMETAAESHGIKNVATSLFVMLDIFEKHIEELVEGWEPKENNKSWVPISTIFGSGTIPAEAAKIIKKAMERAISRGDVSNNAKWQIMEFLAADYLSGE